MHYFSTRDCSSLHSNSHCSLKYKTFSQIVLEGLAPDGGLYIPQSIPQLDSVALAQWSTKSYVELTVELLRLYAPELEQQTACSYNQLAQASSQNFQCKEVTPLKQLKAQSSYPIYIAELFHGPTYAFKDIALQFLGQIFQRLLQQQGRTIHILGATSGDTGGAAIYSVHGMENIQLTIIHPHQAVSEIQRKQMCSVLDNNICNIAIQGNFDQCQSLVKEIMQRSKQQSQGGQEKGQAGTIPHLGAINSINWGRILAQMSYYFALYFRMVGTRNEMRLAQPIRFIVPSGNFGNVLAGYFAKQMGLPIQLVIATNRNNILHQCIAHNQYQPAEHVQPSHAPAMDIVQPSNFERYLWYLFSGDTAQLHNFMIGAKQGNLQQLSPQQYSQICQDFSSAYASDSDLLQAILDCYTNYHYVLDPHTACAYHACRQLEQNMPSVLLATAHPAKFPEVYQALEQKYPNNANAQFHFPVPNGLQFGNAEERYQVLECNTEALLAYLEQNIWH